MSLSSCSTMCGSGACTTHGKSSFALPEFVPESQAPGRPTQPPRLVREAHESVP